jgi:hypothetical protein
MDEYRRLLALQSVHDDHIREAQAERRSHWLLGRARQNHMSISRVWLLLTVLGAGLIFIWGH